MADGAGWSGHGFCKRAERRECFAGSGVGGDGPKQSSCAADAADCGFRRTAEHGLRKRVLLPIWLGPGENVCGPGASHGAEGGDTAGGIQDCQRVAGATDAERTVLPFGGDGGLSQRQRDIRAERYLLHRAGGTGGRMGKLRVRLHGAAGSGGEGAGYAGGDCAELPHESAGGESRGCGDCGTVNRAKHADWADGEPARAGNPSGRGHS